MAGVNKARSTRGRYTSAGYHGPEMYIADVPAGSAQENLRDYNKPAYRSERPWNEAPDPVFETERTQAPQKTVRKKAVKRSFWDRFIAQIKKEKGAFALCAFCLTIMATLMVAGAGSAMDSADIQAQIESYDAKREEFEDANEELERRLEAARSGERIRNEAQNKLNMLRPERANKEKIYIQAMDLNNRQTLQQNEEPRMEMLDILLGLLNLLPVIGE